MHREDLPADEIQVLQSLDHNHRGIPVDAPALTFDQYKAVAIALREKGLLGCQTETVLNDWTGKTRTIVHAVWLTPEGRQVVLSRR